LFLLFLGLALPAAAHPSQEAVGQGILTHILVSKPPASLTVDIILEGYVKHTVFELKSPNRLVIDFPGIVSLTARRSIEFNDHGILRIRTGMFQRDTARVVIDFEEAVFPYQISTIPGGIRLVFPDIKMKAPTEEVQTLRMAPVKKKPQITPAPAGRTEGEKKTPLPLTNFQLRVARSFAAQGKFHQAKDAALYVLRSDPDNVEMLTLVGNSYLQEGQTEEAANYLQRALELAPNNTQATLALVEARLKTEDTHSALIFANQGLRRNPDHPDLLYLKARALLAAEEKQEARTVLEDLLRIQPGHMEARAMLQSIQTRTLSTRLFQRYRYDIFDRDRTDLANLHLLTLGLVLDTPWGPVTGRAHMGFRTQVDLTLKGLQFDLSFHPRLTEKLTAHLHFGYSGADIFAKIRYGAGAAYNIADTWALSGGYYFYQFPSQNVHVATGSLSFTTGNHTLTLQPYLTNRLDLSSVTTILRWRNLLANHVDYIQAYLGMGPTSPEIMFPEDVVRINAQQLGLEIQRQINRSLLLNIQFRVHREEILENYFRYRFTLGLRLEEALPGLF
jgi:YaiO family outer membrane protein